MDSFEKNSSLPFTKDQILQKFNELKSKENLTTAKKNASAMLIRLEVLLKQYLVRASLMIFIASVVLFACSQNECTRGLVLAALAIIFVALTYKLGQANYHKSLFDEGFAIFTVIDEVLWGWVPDLKATREKVDKLNKIVRKSHCVFLS